MGDKTRSSTKRILGSIAFLRGIVVVFAVVGLLFLFLFFLFQSKTMCELSWSWPEAERVVLFQELVAK